MLNSKEANKQKYIMTKILLGFNDLSSFYIDMKNVFIILNVKFLRFFYIHAVTAEPSISFNKYFFNDLVLLLTKMKWILDLS